MFITKRLISGLTLILLLLPSQGASALTEVTIGEVTYADGRATATGTATFDNQPFLRVGYDPAGDATFPPHGPVGADLKSAHIAATATGDIQLRWTLAQLPPVAPPTGIAYVWDFCVNKTDCWHLDVGHISPLWAPPETDGYGVLWKCATPACASAARTLAQDIIPVTFNAGARTVTATLQAAWIGATPGARISPLPVPVSVNGSVYTGTGDAGLPLYFLNMGDGISVLANYTVPTKQVTLQIGDRGITPTFEGAGSSSIVGAGGPGEFVVSWDAPGLSGDKAVYARACYGIGNCGFGAKDVTV
jgi:hypothetical protein